MDLSRIKQHFEPSATIEGMFQALRMRFTEKYDTGLVRFPVTSEESRLLDITIRNAMHIYGNVRTDSATTEAFARAVLYVQSEMAGIRWTMNNPNFATSIARKVLNDRTK